LPDSRGNSTNRPAYPESKRFQSKTVEAHVKKDAEFGNKYKSNFVLRVFLLECQTHVTWAKTPQETGIECLTTLGWDFDNARFL
jgi:hypothetical protein